MPLLSLLTVTKAEPHAFHFIDTLHSLTAGVDSELVIGVDCHDQEDAYEFTRHRFCRHSNVLVYKVYSRGYLESVHDQVLALCDGTYVLRLDDDEQCSPAMARWIHEQRFLEHPHWKFPRAAMWSPTTFITNPPLWPDHQTRLSMLGLANGRDHIHAGSPYGGGEVAPVIIEHHKFLVKTYEQRVEIADRYDRIRDGAGRNGMAAFQLPEDVFDSSTLQTSELGDGHVD